MIFYWVDLRPEKPRIHAKVIMSGWSGQENPRITVTFHWVVSGKENPSIICLVVWLRAKKTRSRNPQGVKNRARKTRGPYSLVESVWSTGRDRVPEISPVERLFRLFPSESCLVNLQPLRKVRIRYVFFLYVVSVCFIARYFFEKIWMHECDFFEKSRGQTVDTSRFEARDESPMMRKHELWMQENPKLLQIGLDKPKTL